MKPPKTPFWAWNDIGSTLKWHLCVIRGCAEQPMIYYAEDDFEDYWNEDDFSPEEIKLIKVPASL